MITFWPGCWELMPGVGGLLTTTVREPIPPIPGILPGIDRVFYFYCMQNYSRYIMEGIFITLSPNKKQFIFIPLLLFPIFYTVIPWIKQFSIKYPKNNRWTKNFSVHVCDILKYLLRLMCHLYKGSNISIDVEKVQGIILYCNIDETHGISLNIHSLHTSKHCVISHYNTLK